MAKASHDQNFIKGKLGVWCFDGVTKIPIACDSSGAVKIDTISTISYTPSPIDPRDQNYQSCWLFEGSDGLTYPANVNADGALLVDM